VRRFFDTRTTIANISDEDVIDYFHNGIATQTLYRDFGCNRPNTVVKLRDMMQWWADKEEQECDHFPRRNNDYNRRRNNDHANDRSQRDPIRKRKPDDVIGAIERNPRGKKQGNQQDQFDKISHKGA